MPPVILLYVVDPLERAGRTFLQQFTTILLAGGGGGGVGLLVTQNWALAVNSALFAAVVSILTSVLTFKVPKLPPGLDLLLRVLKTYLQSFVGTLTASAVLDISHADWKGALAVGVPTSLLALITGIAALGVAGTDGASLLPSALSPLDDDDALPVVNPDDDPDEAVYPDYSDIEDDPLREDEEQPEPGGELDGPVAPADRHPDSYPS